MHTFEVGGDCRTPLGGGTFKPENYLKLKTEERRK